MAFRTGDLKYGVLGPWTLWVLVDHLVRSPQQELHWRVRPGWPTQVIDRLPQVWMRSDLKAMVSNEPPGFRTPGTLRSANALRSLNLDMAIA